MFTTYSHLKAEDNYRRELLRDQRHTDTKGRAARTVAALVLVGAMALAACGAPVEADAGNPADTQSAILSDNGPTWEPYRALLEEILTIEESDLEVMAARIEAPEYGPMAAPSWQPSRDALGSFSEVDTGSVSNTEPFGHPNYGRLDTYLGTERLSGIR